MNLQDLAKTNELANEGVWVQITHPQTRQPIDGVRFKIIGNTSDKFYELRDALAREAVESDGKVNHEDMTMRMIAGMVVDIEGLEDNGKPIKDAMKVFKTPGLKFIFKQLDIEAGTRSNFLPPESKN